MATSTLSKRVRDHLKPDSGVVETSRLGHPLALAATTLVLLAIFGSTFIIHPGRPAPADDPAYYSWRTELLISEGPGALLDATGPREMYSSGYRVATNLLGGVFRRVAGVAPLTQTAWLMVGLRVLIPLLLAGLVAYHRRDPLAFHVVALASASLLLTPPLGGYLDNLVTLSFLTAAAFFIRPAADSWAARLIFGALLFVSALTHPTTLVIFCGVLAAMATARAVFFKFDVRTAMREYAAPLGVAFTAVVVGYLVWKLGVWGQPASLGDAALPPPAPASFFMKRLGGWVRALRPLLNGPLFILGLLALVAVGRRWIQDEVARLAVVWLLPLVGVFGFLAGLAFPYYRFLNTTLSWVLLVAIGSWIAVRFFVLFARRRGPRAVAGSLGVLAVGLIVVTNFTAGFKLIGWNELDMAWMTPAEHRDLDALRPVLDSESGPLVFTVTTDATASERIWGAVKRAGNVARYGVPGRLLDSTYVCLGTVESCARNEPSGEPGSFHRELSQATLDHMTERLEDRGALFVHASVFNTDPGAEPPSGLEVWRLEEGSVVASSAPGDQNPLMVARESSPSSLAWLRALGGLILILIPGLLALRGTRPRLGAAQLLGLVPVISAALLISASFVCVAALRSPLSARVAWLSWGVAIVMGWGLARLGRENPETA